MKTHAEQTTHKKKKKSGFTLIEVIAVLILLGILAAIALPKYIDMTAQARDRAIDAAVSELNGREALAWSKEMLATSGAPVDATVFSGVDTANLGGAYTWSTGPSVTGGALQFQSQPTAGVTLTRTANTIPAEGPAIWKR